MHIIQDIEGFFKDLEATVYAWFGTGKNGEEGKDAIKVAVAKHIMAVPTGTLTPAETVAAPEPEVSEPKGDIETSAPEVEVAHG